jgi:hypothetical protein
MPIQCPYCPKWLKNQQAVNRHIGQSERCRTKRQRVVADITLSDRLYDPFDPADISSDDEPSAEVMHAMTLIPPDEYADVTFEEYTELLEPEDVFFEEDEDLEAEAEADAEEAEDEGEDLEEENVDEPMAYPRSQNPFIVEHPTAAATFGQGQTRFEARRQAELENGDDGWGSFIDQAHHELAEWLLGSGLSHAKMRRYFELKAVRQLLVI